MAKMKIMYDDSNEVEKYVLEFLLYLTDEPQVLVIEWMV